MTVKMPSAGLAIRLAVPQASRAPLENEMARGQGRRLPLERIPATGDSEISIIRRRQVRQMRTGRSIVLVEFKVVQLRVRVLRRQLNLLTITLQAGPLEQMLALAQRWLRRFKLVLEPRTEDDFAGELNRGLQQGRIRVARRLAYPAKASTSVAFATIVDECLDQIVRNTSGLVERNAEARAAQVHQLRVGIRRLRSALDCFRGCVNLPPPPLEEALRALFRLLGQARDADVLDGGVAADLVRAGAPPLNLRVESSNTLTDLSATVASPQTQEYLLGWLGWRAQLGDCQPEEEIDLLRHARRRLNRWHARIVLDTGLFETLDEQGLHDLRKRIKRQRYAMEFFAPVLPQKATARYLHALSDAQQRMGTMNDLFVARDRYQELVSVGDSSAWFALGWLAARLAEARAAALPSLKTLAKLTPTGR